MRLLLAVLAAALLLPATGLAADAKGPVTETATSGSVTATFSYDDAGNGVFKDLNITVTRGGAQAYSGMPAVRGCATPYCAPDTYDGGQRRALTVTDVTDDGEPEVIVNMYSGGAHCCEIAVVLRWTGNAYKVLQHNFADPGYKLVAAPAGGGPTAFVSADARFGYEFVAYAFSAMPVQIYRIEDGAWSDQTLSYEASIKADAAKWRKAYMKVRKTRGALGLLAAYVADEYQLDRAAAADAFLQHELRAGRLKTTEGWPGGKAYIKLLKKDLKAWGYVSRRGATL
jgi:hypothetical protein